MRLQTLIYQLLNNIITCLFISIHMYKKSQIVRSKGTTKYHKDYTTLFVHIIFMFGNAFYSKSILAISVI